MFKIIDRTLTGLKVEQHDFSQKKLYKLCELLVKLGVDYIEVSVPILEKIGQLPPEGHYILKIESLEQYGQYSDMNMYTMDYEYNLEKSIYEMKDDILYEIHVRSISELNRLNDFQEVFGIKNIRITGLDDMICADLGETKSSILEGVKKRIDFCPQDHYYCATALAIEWLISGGRNISVSFNGIGGYAKLEEVLLGIKIIMHKKLRQELSILTEISRAYEALIGKHIYYNKAVIGRNIFNLEAGIQACHNARNAITYEPYDPATVGRVRRIVIGKNSSYSALKLKLKEEGIRVPDIEFKELLEKVRHHSISLGRSLTDREFVVLVQEVLKNEA